MKKKFELWATVCYDCGANYFSLKRDSDCKECGSQMVESEFIALTDDEDPIVQDLLDESPQEEGE